MKDRGHVTLHSASPGFIAARCKDEVYVAVDDDDRHGERLPATGVNRALHGAVATIICRSGSVGTAARATPVQGDSNGDASTANRSRGRSADEVRLNGKPDRAALRSMSVSVVIQKNGNRVGVRQRCWRDDGNRSGTLRIGLETIVCAFSIKRRKADRRLVKMVFEQAVLRISPNNSRRLAGLVHAVDMM